ncbi:uncharacterized protein K489DRAFT_111962 [Dissoconium aciculare CBS 342.82]|uniref:Uncharacterized protein n=1 Tax=Dissoconium aciculare CBS 342.82 TaxID=1314786 RepID=A0A6J3ME67_9PEZI|nr:uncharacterized protein K489DRAFT_111962 [Dissoconium aciculare CBS 342.82]KAF1826306.1 hypothetical protein K489DRAFT_111962 [Dissoconium aciculare CBS 342.82]
MTREMFLHLQHRCLITRSNFTIPLVFVFVLIYSCPALSSSLSRPIIAGTSVCEESSSMKNSCSGLRLTTTSLATSLAGTFELGRSARSGRSVDTFVLQEVLSQPRLQCEQGFDRPLTPSPRRWCIPDNGSEPGP